MADSALLASLSSDLVLTKLAGFLEPQDVAQLQAGDAALRVCCGEPPVWRASCSACLPSLDLAESLFAVPQKAEFLTLLPSLVQAQAANIFEKNSLLRLHTLSEAKKAAKLLATAQRTAASHLSSGGTAAYVTVTTLKFDRETAPSVGGKTLTHDVTSAPASTSPLCLGDDVPLSLGGLRRLCVAFQGRSLLISARSDAIPAEDILMPRKLYEVKPHGSDMMTLDIMSLSSAVTLNHRDVPLMTDLTWFHAATGVSSLPGSKTATQDILSRGIPCVLILRDGQPQMKTNIARSLHLDKPLR